MKMSEEKLYLKKNIQLEPLVNQWYAWIHLISPVPASMNLVDRYLKIMKSYVSSPMMHEAAVNDPAMRGGPFIDLGGVHVDEVRELIKKTETNNKTAIAFVEALRGLNKLILSKAKGYCLEELYIEVPSLLRGYVELCYDLNNQASFRIIESMLYKSKFYDHSIQSIALSEIITDGDRPFLLSTPNLKSEKNVHIDIAFSSSVLDELFKMKSEAKPYSFIRNQLDVPVEKEDLFRSFFTEEPPTRYAKYTGESMRIRYFGHACILIETKDISILLDPVLSYTYESNISRYTYEDLPDEIDYVLITHSHQDHILLETMLQLRNKIKNIVVGRNIDGAIQDPSIKLTLTNMGFDNVREIYEYEEIPIPGGTIMGVPFLGEHHDLLIHSKLSYLVKIDDHSVLAVADSCNIEPELYKNIQQITGNIDALFLGMECDGSPVSWAYGPLFDEPMNREMDRSRRGRGCNFEEGIDIVRRFDFKEVYVYAMGQEPWLRHILDLEYDETANPIIQSEKLITECKQQGIIAERLYGEKEILTTKKTALI